jgi:hypothetical protein
MLWRSAAAHARKGSERRAEEAGMDAVLRRSGTHGEGRREVQQKGGGGTNGRCGEAQRHAHSREATRAAGREVRGRNGCCTEAQQRTHGREVRGATGRQRRHKWTLWQGAATRTQQGGDSNLAAAGVERLRLRLRVKWEHSTNATLECVVGGYSSGKGKGEGIGNGRLRI